MNTQKWTRFFYQPGIGLGENGSRLTQSREHIDISRQAACEGMVLLKNDRDILPVAEGTRLALFGKGTFDYVKGGGGSGDVGTKYITNLYEGMKQMTGHVTVYEPLADFYREDVNRQYSEGAAPGMTAEPAIPEELLGKAAAFADLAVISICRFSGEGWDRKSSFDEQLSEGGEEADAFTSRSNELFPRGDFYLTDAEQEMVEKVCSHFDKVAVVLNVGGMIDTSWFADDDRIGAVLMGWQAGMEGGLAEAELLCGLAVPSGKLSDTFAARLEDYPSADTFHESEDYVCYYEDIYVGYRYFETIPGAAEKVVYPFGYGLSYTTFEVLDPAAECKEDRIVVTCDVRNTGSYAGKEVVQVYYSAPDGKLGKPARELAGFKKTRLLQPGEMQHVIISFPVSDMASYDDLGKVAASSYVLEKGTYSFHVGTSVRDTVCTAFALTLEKDETVCTLERRMAPSMLPKRLRSDGTFEELPMGTDPRTISNNGLTPMTEDELWAAAPAVRPAPPVKLFEREDKGIRLSDVAEGKISLDEFMKELTDEDLAWLLGGQPNIGPANTFGFGNNLRLGIPPVMTADGPAGLRFQPWTGVTTTAFPCATLLACTWDPETVYKVGRAGAEEVKENNVGVWLTPAINIHRNPLCGRNFEYYSEDPFLAGSLAGAMVRGIQSMHIAASVKHFALNNKETNRKESDSRASERAIREIYLKAFEKIVKEADPWTIMSSYNLINGHRASENEDLLTHILRGEWGFKGMVTTDWWTNGEQYVECAAGNDMKMGCGYPERVMEALEKGLITRDVLETAAKRILGMILKLD